MRRPATAALFLALALIYVFPALGPGRILAPMDIPRDRLAWKGDPATRVRVSNSLLSDVPLQLVPWDLESRRLLSEGEMPWCNRFAGSGEALFANPLAALLSPMTWPRLLLGLEGWEWTVLLKIVLAGLGMVWLARVAGASPLAATLSGVVFALSGYSIVWALYPHTNVVALLPPLAAAALGVAREPSGRRIAILAAIAALATAGGHPEGLFVGVVAIAIWLFFADAPRKLPAAGAALAGFLIVGIQLVPFFVLLARSWVIEARSEQLGLAFRKFSILSLVLPGYLGSPLRGELDLTALFAGTENFHQRNGAFIGALALLAIVLAAVRRSPAGEGDEGRPGRPFRAALIVAAAALVLSLSVPGLAHLLRRIPLIGWTAPEYWAIGFVLFASLAAGPALVRTFGGPVRRRLGIALIVIGGTAAAAGALPALAPGLLQSVAREGIARLQVRGHLAQAPEVYQQRLAGYLEAARGTALRRVTLPALCWTAFGAALLMAPGRRRTAIAAGAVVAELVAFGWGYNPAIRTDEVAGEPAMLAAVRAADPEGRWAIASSNEVFPPNLATIWRVRDVHAYDILVSREEVERLLPAGYDPMRWGLPLVPSPEERRALAALGVRFHLTPRGVIEIADAALIPPPPNVAPDGLAAGALVSLLGAALLALVIATSRSRRAGSGPE
ncbi:MAG TPA: hypothetical protein VMS56_12545 [Thermoanaerobaculia bacterium]|nr:hypothetical protein [Thermoanaerobaculia bacterium]